MKFEPSKVYRVRGSRERSELRLAGLLLQFEREVFARQAQAPHKRTQYLPRLLGQRSMLFIMR